MSVSFDGWSCWRAPARRDRPSDRRRARILLADEPTGALDSVNGEAVIRLLRAATNGGVAGVVVTHEAQLASWADRVVFLRDGHVVDQTVAPPGPESLLAALTGDDDARSSVGAGGARRTAALPPAARSFAGPGGCSGASGARQILVTALLTVAVAAAIGSVTVAYNSAPAEDAEFGSAGHLLRFDGGDPRLLAAGLAAAEERFGTIDVIGHRSLTVPRRRRQGRVPRPGPARGVRWRAPGAPPRQLPERSRRSCRHRRRGHAP